MISFFGDSHLTAYISANKKYAIFPEARMFPAPQGNFERATLAVSNEKISTNLPEMQEHFQKFGQRDSIPLTNLNTLVLVSWFARPFIMWALLGSTRPRKAFLPMRYYDGSPGQVPISEEMYHSFLQQAAQFELPFLEKLRENFHGKILLLPRPLPASMPPYMKSVVIDRVSIEIKRNLFEDVQGQIQEVANKLDMIFVPQDSKTIDENTILTKPEFTAGSVSMITGEDHSSKEYRHMNTDYGLVMLERLRNLL